MSAPTTNTQVRRFTGATRFYLRYIYKYANVCGPLSRLIGSKTKYVWEMACQEAFEAMKDKLGNPPIMKEPNWSKNIHLHTNASLIAT